MKRTATACAWLLFALLAVVLFAECDTIVNIDLTGPQLQNEAGNIEQTANPTPTPEPTPTPTPTPSPTSGPD